MTATRMGVVMIEAPSKRFQCNATDFKSVSGKWLAVRAGPRRQARQWITRARRRLGGLLTTAAVARLPAG